MVSVKLVSSSSSSNFSSKSSSGGGDGFASSNISNSNDVSKHTTERVVYNSKAVYGLGKSSTCSEDAVGGEGCAGI